MVGPAAREFRMSLDSLQRMSNNTEGLLDQQSDLLQFWLTEPAFLHQDLISD